MVNRSQASQAFPWTRRTNNESPRAGFGASRRPRPGIVPDINDPTAGQVALGIVGDAIEGYGCPAMSPVAEAATPEVDPQQVIDQVFDCAEKMLTVQREFAKSRAAVPDRQGKPPASNPNPL